MLFPVLSSFWSWSLSCLGPGPGYMVVMVVMVLMVNGFNGFNGRPGPAPFQYRHIVPILKYIVTNSALFKVFLKEYPSWGNSNHTIHGPYMSLFLYFSISPNINLNVW